MSKRIIQKRIMVMLGVFGVLFVVLVGRLFYLQIISGAELKQEAMKLQMRDTVVYSKRGTIYDRNGKELAVSVTAENVIADPAAILKSQKSEKAKSPEEIARILSDILELEYDEVYAKITKENSNYQEIKLRVDNETADRVREAELTGISLVLDSKREYVYDDLASFVIGFTGRDNQGLQGIEMVYDEALKGMPGRIENLTDPNGQDLPYQYQKYIDPVDGQNLYLTIDETIQHFAEKYIEEAVDLYNVLAGGVAIVMDPNSGEILAMACTDNYDLNQPMTLLSEEAQALVDAAPEDQKSAVLSEQLNKQWRNKAVTEAYEPGSVFKMITMASALEEGVVTLSNTFNCTGNRTISGSDTINCWRYYNPHGVQNIMEGLRNSCNCVFMDVGALLGEEAFMKYYKAFGFTATTGFDLPGESAGVWHASFSPVDLAVSSFGQSQIITPLQMISAASAVVNGGKLYRPHLVRQFTNLEGNVVETVEPQVVRQVISEDTSAIMRQALENVVDGGTGSNAYLKGYRVGGKTGTSEKLPRGNGKKIASFFGVAPCDNPQVAVLVILDDPTPDETQNGGGGAIAAPTAGKILNDVLNYMGIQPQFSEEELAQMDVIVPDLTGEAITAANERLTNMNLKTQIVGSGETVLSQTPGATATVQAGSTVILYTTDQTEAPITVPDVTGLTVEEAMNRLTVNGLNGKITGVGATSEADGYEVVSQEPGAGQTVPKGSVVYVEARNKDVD